MPFCESVSGESSGLCFIDASILKLSVCELLWLICECACQFRRLMMGPQLPPRRTYLRPEFV